MDKDLWDFIGVSRSSNGEADRLLDEIVMKMFQSLNTFLGMHYNAYSGLNDMIQAGIKQGGPYAYFWTWLRDHGSNSLVKIGGTVFRESDETLDCLEERLFIMDFDIENGLVEAYFESIAATLTAIETLASGYSQLASGRDKRISEPDIDVTISLSYKVPRSEQYREFVIQNSVAYEQRSFCLDIVNF